MGGAAFVDLHGESFVRLHDVGVAMAVLDPHYELVSATPAAVELLRRFELPVDAHATLPPKLAHEIACAPLGEAIMWRHPSGDLGATLGCTRYSLGDEHLLLLMREITEQQRALSRKIHRQRLEATGRLISHIAHDLRAPLSSIIYSVDVLAKGGHTEETRTIELAALALRDTIAGLLDFVRIGPPVTTTQSLGRTFERISGLLRPAFRRGRHELAIELHDDAVCVRGNTIALEQIFVNLLINATESRPERVHVRVTSEQSGSNVIVRVSDDGPGIPKDRRASIFDEFVTSKPNGTGLGLTVAREAALSLGGELELEAADIGCTFAVELPAVAA
ncbi:MAG: ATP-binding protein [Kofleriaceae bacterium]